MFSTMTTKQEDVWLQSNARPGAMFVEYHRWEGYLPCFRPIELLGAEICTSSWMQI